jgi:hypothetical protein
VKEIPLTQGQVTLVDDEDFERLSAFKWFAHWDPSTQSFRAMSNSKGSKRKSIYMARFIMRTPKGMVCDHINHDTLYNLKINLRNCTLKENARNRRKYSVNTTGFKGVSRHEKGYRASFRMNGKQIFSKTFPTPEEAAAVYEKETKKHYGEFACTE